ncbi:MAG: UDP-N-acetylmuramate:L-alanyl-gamma-D-glutamyl-meso-diaminopimelate ligase [Gammaproteobacteria bacterium]|nr:UDP-N-acetylmuramate:L-alanyl-gamma-D-glutamyl-meso-diaminopimelate ligase [Gammaproteobacteria bacterium]
MTTNKPHIHILGIAGTFMTGLAILAKQLGYKVTGTDYKIYPPMSDVLAAENIHCLEGYDNPENIDYLNKADCVIIGNALSRGNYCIEYILEYKLLFKSGPAWLAENILQHKWVLAVSGTHGKTTTSSMLSWILEYNNLNPSFLIGGLANNFNSTARYTDSKYFVIEADEYDTAFFDKRPKFLHYFPNTLIINNIEYDHADIYPNIQSIEQQFGYLLRTVPKNNGHIIAPIELQNKLTGSTEYIYKYGVGGKTDLNIKYFNSDNFISAILKNQAGNIFDCYYNKSYQGTVDYNLLGQHNLNNALAAILAAHSIGIEMPDAIKALCDFKGVARRLEKKGEIDHILIFDDFAHHPTAIKTTLMGLRNRYINNNIYKKLAVILDFSSYSMRTKVHSDQDFLQALELADTVYFYQDSGMGWDCAELLEKFKLTNKQGYLYKNSEELIDNLATETKQGDVIVFMTKSAFNSNISQLINKLQLTLTTALETCDYSLPGNSDDD